MKALVCGGRNYSDANRVFVELDRIHAERPIDLVIHGGASGADLLGWSWAIAKNIPAREYPADWVKHPKVGGFIRNQQMADAKPDVCIAFPGGNGTADMVARARKAGIELIEF